MHERRQRCRAWKDIPAATELSHSISRALKKRGFRFMGPTVTYAFMQVPVLCKWLILSCCVS